ETKPVLLGETVQKVPVAVDELAVREDLAARAKVADQIPVQGRAVQAPRLLIRGPEGEVDLPADLLVEQGVAREELHRVVQAERELAHPPGPLVHRDHLAEEVLAARGGRLDHLSALEAKPDVVDLPRVEDRWIGEADFALDAGLDRGSEDLAVREVFLPVRGNPRPALGHDPP